MSGRVVILGAGARTPLGRNRQSSAAAWRCAISAADDYPDLRDRFGQPFKVARDTGIDLGLRGAARLTALALPAAVEALAPLASIAHAYPPLTLLLATGEPRTGQEQGTSEALMQRLLQALQPRIAIAERAHAMTGHAGGTGMIDAASRLIQEGRAQMVLVGGVDSYLDPPQLNALDLAEQLHSEGNIYGFCPGEAASFLLLTSASTAQQLRLRPLLAVLRTASARETVRLKDDGICLGLGLSQAFREIAEPLTQARANGAAPADLPAADWVLCDMNGERYRANEYGMAALRVPELFRNAASFQPPADCFGDVGAASGPLHACLAIEAEARGYAPGPLTLIWGSSEHGQRSAALLGRIERG
ncbi:beta-ketoacyl synthase N-terminal-like domain-containing protein [Xinfangfangia sp. CPCC 101601]|uniref:Beta-ketoacyl synthase N-terminal-like domain-containing protein n=1 Tax=Pseudogemmobacter lacusdianii TaxID=3069608 RepID=A0ABU0VZ95_9RHOB|nr:beta-ketoacyl synthase N-terminal-like domain-containing protein [Xinfangfangia sp. CPCC 101601]MDQ2067068.1 beta-ketoacyl synthase N-terminal-like domain-containing protein [Xinfangfangia sp. CPCC 101601]